MDYHWDTMQLGSISSNDAFVLKCYMGQNLVDEILCNNNGEVIKHKGDMYSWDSFIDSYMLCKLGADSSYCILDDKGNFVENIVGENEEVYGLKRDVTGVSVIVIQETDSYEGRKTIIRFKDIEGNVKYECDISGREIDNDYYKGDGIYVIEDIGIDINRKITFQTNDDLKIYDDYVMYGYSYGFELYDRLGNKITDHKQLVGDVVSEYGKPGEGLIYMETRDNRKGMFDFSGNLVIDMSGYKDVFQKPEFNEKKAWFSVWNSEKVPFVACMDETGNLLFEPIEGNIKCIVDDKCLMYRKNDNIETRYEEYYIIGLDGDVVSLGSNFAYKFVENGVIVGVDMDECKVKKYDLNGRLIGN